jgi:hypothetical protein
MEITKDKNCAKKIKLPNGSHRFVPAPNGTEFTNASDTGKKKLW